MFCDLGSCRATAPHAVKLHESVMPKGLNSEPLLYRKAWESSLTSCVIGLNKNKIVSIKYLRKTVVCVISDEKTVIVFNAVNQAFQNDAKARLIHEKRMLAVNLLKSRLNTKH